MREAWDIGLESAPSRAASRFQHMPEADWGRWLMLEEVCETAKAAVEINVQDNMTDTRTLSARQIPRLTAPE